MATSSRRRGFVCASILFAVVVGCGREVTEPVAPEHAALETAISSRSPLRENKPPLATILDPVSGGAFVTVLEAPITIRWTGSDPEGRLREYRYRLFDSTNSDFPDQPDFLAYLYANPEAVLAVYAPQFKDWERLDPRGVSESAVTYSTLAPQRYGFVVVAIDQRGAHDVTLSRDRNILDFMVQASPPGMKFIGEVGEVWIPEGASRGAVLEAAGSETTVHWRFTPSPGETVAGYRSLFDLSQQTSAGPFSPDNTSATIARPAEGEVWFYVEVEMGSGLRRLYLVGVVFVMA